MALSLHNSLFSRVRTSGNTITIVLELLSHKSFFRKTSRKKKHPIRRSPKGLRGDYLNSEIRQSLKLELYRLMAVTLTFSIAFMMINPILPLYIVEVGASELELGLIMAISSFSGILLRIPFGMISDRFGRKFVMLFSLLTFSFALSFMAMVRSIVWLYPAALLLSIPMSSYMPSSTAAVMDIAPKEERGVTMGIYFTSFGTATILGPLLTSILVKFLSYRQLLLVTSLFPVIALAILIQGGLSGGRAAIANKESSSDVLNSIRRLLASKSLVGLSLGRVLYSTPNFVFATLFPVYANKDLLMTASTISLLYSARGTANALSRLPSGKLCDVIKPKKLLLLAYLISSMFYLTIPSLKLFHLLAVLMAIHGIAWGVRIVSDQTIASEILEPEVRGLGTAFLGTMFSAGRFLGSLLAGVFASIMPVPRVIQLFGIMPAVGSLVVLFLVREEDL